MSKIKPSELLKEVSLLYVEDDEGVKESLAGLLKRYLREVYTASNGEEGLMAFMEFKPDMVVSDIRMPVMDGLEMAKHIKEVSPETPILFITAFSDIDYLLKALEIGAEGYITKPLNFNLLYKKLNFFAENIVNRRRLQEYNRILSMLIDEYSSPVAMLEGNRIKLSNRAFREVFGDITYIEEICGKVATDQRECESIDLSKDRFIICLSLGEVEVYYEVQKKDVGKFRILYFTDITEFRSKIFTDDLTQVYNRKYMHVLERNMIGKRVCLVMCDIDNFKSINDTYGHREGDRVLSEMGRLLKGTLRRTDVVVRYGGEEFLILLSNVESSQTAYYIVENLRKKVASIRVGERPVSCSFGISCGEINSRGDFIRLVEEADKALYEAKRLGKNRTEVYTSHTLNDSPR